jgi:hypothetical protein
MEVSADRVTSVSIRRLATLSAYDKGGESLSALPALLSACIG